MKNSENDRMFTLKDLPRCGSLFSFLFFLFCFVVRPYVRIVYRIGIQSGRDGETDRGTEKQMKETRDPTDQTIRFVLFGFCMGFNKKKPYGL